MHELTYPEIGATRTPDELPPGYNHLRYRTCLGPGELAVAGEAIMTWRMHRAAGVRISASAPRAAPGVAVVNGVGLGPLRVSVPCRVVWAADAEDRIGFGYGTLPGHVERGEEAFCVERAGDGQVWFTVTAFSAPARWYTRAAGPLVPLLQRAYAWHCGRALRRLCSR